MLCSCSSLTESGDGEQVYFEFKTTGDEHFFARTSDQEVIKKAREQLARPKEERGLMINGEIARGTEQNNGWSWHFVPDKWNLVEVSMEVCDGRPSYVEKEIDYWVDNVGRFCPWNSKVIKEVGTK